MLVHVTNVLPHVISVNIGETLPISMKFGSATDSTTISLNIDGARDIINRLQKAVDMLEATEPLKK